jgi:hypothetical protein
VKVFKAIIKFKTAKVKEGEDLIKLSLIFILTINPASINKLNPEEAANNNIGLK